MNCCGQHRDAIRVQSGIATVSQVAATPARPTSTRSVAPISPGNAMALLYREHTRMLVRGPTTGRTYLFAPMQPTAVDVRDAEVLLRTRQFLAQRR